MAYKIRKVRFEITSIYEIETDLATSDKEAVEHIKQELQDCNLQYYDNPEVEYIGWDIGKVRIVK